MASALHAAVARSLPVAIGGVGLGGAAQGHGTRRALHRAEHIALAAIDSESKRLERSLPAVFMRITLNVLAEIRGAVGASWVTRAEHAVAIARMPEAV